MSRHFDENPYYNPEACGLTQIGVADEDLCYEFNTLVVWRDNESGDLYWSSDSGCSCPTPFEDDRDLADLRKLDKNDPDWQRVVDEFMEKDADGMRKILAKI